jgi:hypothetical protein
LCCVDRDASLARRLDTPDAMASRALCLLAMSVGAYAQGGALPCLNQASRLQHMNDVCCATEPGGQCLTGYPSQCSAACAGLVNSFVDDCGGAMMGILQTTLGQAFTNFIGMCQASQVVPGVSTTVTGNTILVEFEVNMRGITLHPGETVAVYGSFNQWAHNGHTPLQLTQSPTQARVWRGNIGLSQGTWVYKYVIVNPAGTSRWETVPEYCGLRGNSGSVNRVVTIVGAATGLVRMLLAVLPRLQIVTLQ